MLVWAHHMFARRCPPSAAPIVLDRGPITSRINSVQHCFRRSVAFFRRRCLTTPHPARAGRITIASLGHAAIYDDRLARRGSTHHRPRSHQAQLINLFIPLHRHPLTPSLVPPRLRPKPASGVNQRPERSAHGWWCRLAVRGRDRPARLLWMACPGRLHVRRRTAGGARRAGLGGGGERAVAFEPVRMLVDPVDRGWPRPTRPRGRALRDPLDDAWIRDPGRRSSSRRPAPARRGDWIFNGWGGHRGRPGTATARRGTRRSRRPAPRWSPPRSSTRAAASTSTARDRAAHRDRAARPAPQPRAVRAGGGGARPHHRRDDVVWLPRGLTRTTAVRHPRARRHLRDDPVPGVRACSTSSGTRPRPDHAE